MQRTVSDIFVTKTYSQLSEYFNTERTLNFTITFNSNYSTPDTLYVGPKAFNEYLKKNISLIEDYYMVGELHKNGRKHLHGQILMKQDQRANLIFYCQTFSFHIHRYFGISTLKWNTFENYQRSDSYWPTYFDYAFKEMVGKVLMDHILFHSSYRRSIPASEIVDDIEREKFFEKERLKKRARRIRARALWDDVPDYHSNDE